MEWYILIKVTPVMKVEMMGTRQLAWYLTAPLKEARPGCVAGGGGSHPAVAHPRAGYEKHRAI